MRSQTTRTIAGRVNADGSIATGSGFTVQKVASGTYTIRFPGSRLIGAALVNTQAQNILMAMGVITGDSFSTYVFVASTGATGDAAYSFVATVAA